MGELASVDRRPLLHTSNFRHTSLNTWAQALCPTSSISNTSHKKIPFSRLVVKMLFTCSPISCVTETTTRTTNLRGCPFRNSAPRPTQPSSPALLQLVHTQLLSWGSFPHWPPLSFPNQPLHTYPGPQTPHPTIQVTITQVLSSLPTPNVMSLFQTWEGTANKKRSLGFSM